MPHSLSTDLRLRVVAFIEEGHSRNEAAARFKTSVSFEELQQRFAPEFCFLDWLATLIDTDDVEGVLPYINAEHISRLRYVALFHCHGLL